MLDVYLIVISGSKFIRGSWSINYPKSNKEQARAANVSHCSWLAGHANVTADKGERIYLNNLLI